MKQYYIDTIQAAVTEFGTRLVYYKISFDAGVIRVAVHISADDHLIAELWHDGTEVRCTEHGN